VQAPDGLDGVGVHGHAPLAGPRREGGDRLHDAGLVVHPHHRADGGIRGEGGGGRGGIDHAVAVDGEQPLVGALGGGVVDGGEHRLVLDRGAHDAAPPFVPARAPRAEHREVVGLRAPGGEHDLVGARAEGRAEPLAGLVERGPRGAPPPVRARRVAEQRAVEGLHRRAHLGPHGRRGGVVEVDRGG
jgi:hypothetical protein